MYTCCHLTELSPHQVFALSSQGDHIYFRKDVDPSEPCGREWKLLKIKPGNVEFLAACESVPEPRLDSPSGLPESSSDTEEAVEAVSGMCLSTTHVGNFLVECEHRLFWVPGSRRDSSVKYTGMIVLSFRV